MKNVQVLGTGCANCKATVKLIEDAAQARGMAVAVEKVENIADIMAYGVMSTPGVVIDGKVVHTGGVPDRKRVEGWLGDGSP
ncbi:MAG: thioredoxin family protein [Sulfuricaulis sp.]|uniref:thioredoxin family protein n=1 Tax=Sulfuricaulis sp. TaxID=2003553 RepID=UPI0034A559AC